MRENDADLFSVDFETYYDPAYSLKKMSTWAYVYHEKFDAYLVAVAGPNDFKWVGAPKDFDWTLLKGKTLLHHNATFDRLVMRRLIQDGIIPDIEFGPTYDTADLAAYMQYPRALKDFMAAVWGLKDDAAEGKQVRNMMLGMASADLVTNPRVVNYCAKDAIASRRIWTEFSHLWPDEERDLSRLNRESGWYGVAVDMPYVLDCIHRLEERLFDAARDIPWEWDKNKTPLSRKKVIEHCKQTIVFSRPATPAELRFPYESGSLEAYLFNLWETEGGKPDFKYSEVALFDGHLHFYMWYPESFGKDDEECIAWEEEFADQFPWIRALRDWRRLNMIYQKFVHLRDNIGTDGRYHFNKKYYGAQRTGRFSGSGGFNMENMPRDEMFCLLDEAKEPIPGTGFDLRRCFIGNFAIVDYSQVEARILLAVVKDEDTLEKVRGGTSVYEAHARATMGWTGGKLKDEDPDLYRLAKSRVLGLGYGCGHKKFIVVAKMMAGLVISEEESYDHVQAYRQSNPKITQFWYRMNDAAHQSARRKQASFDVKLPSGRVLKYWSPRYRTVKREKPDGTKEITNELFSMELFNWPMTFRKTYGGKIVENLIQGIARDVLRDAWLALDRAGYRVLFTVHDEFVIDLQEGQTLAEAERIIKTPQPWAEFIPLDVEGKVSPVFTK